MTFDGSTSGEPYFWHCGAPTYAVMRCDICGARFDDADELRWDAAFEGWTCEMCRTVVFLEAGRARRTMDMGGGR